MKNKLEVRDRISQVPVHEISFKDVDGYAVNDQERLQEELKKLKLFGEQFGYSAFSPDLLPLVLKTGTYRHTSGREEETVYCCEVREDPIEPTKITDGGDCIDLVGYMVLCESQGITFATFAVYDLEQLEEVSCDEFRFKNQDNKLGVLVSVVKVNDFWPL